MLIPKSVMQVLEMIRAATGLSIKTLFAWMIAENNEIEMKFPDNNNPLNIRYLGNSHPWLTSYEWFKGTNGIQGNLVVTYESPEAFGAAVVSLLHNLTQYYQGILDSASGSDEAQAEAIERSPWDGANYGRVGDQPGNIVKLVQSITIEEPTPAQPEPQQPAEQEAPSASLDEVQIHHALVDTAVAAGALWACLDEAGKAVVHSHMQAIRSYLIDKYGVAVSDID